MSQFEFLVDEEQPSSRSSDGFICGDFYLNGIALAGEDDFTVDEMEVFTIEND